MKDKKKIIILSFVLLILIIIIILLSINIKNKSTFVKPEFDSSVLTEIPESIDYKDSTLNISENYDVYINGLPKVEDDNLIIDFISLKENNVWIKIRVLDETEKVIAESGLVKPGEYLRSINLSKQKQKNDKIIYMIIGYEIDTYLSAGTIKLNTRIGE